eukprot:TRINITY_DN4799_c0_g1_i1.p1 TRINITY_DN4799_c0_g1~~TRINITY_DN4799_c0_g1_i1.p1  ORF type:complete len:234 (-),score=21.96 TRINITY_DN4799_c0_g1_i1:118-759(-)
MNPCVVICCCCCCFCVCILAMISVVVVSISHLSEPKIGVENFELRTFNVNSTCLTIDAIAEVWVSNPNGWPWSGTLADAEVNVLSLDLWNSTKPPLLIGTASLSDSVDISEHKNVSFTMELRETLQRSGHEDLIGRLMRNCRSSDRQTKFRVEPVSVKLAMWGNEKSVRLPEQLADKYSMTTLVTCPKSNVASLPLHGGVSLTPVVPLSHTIV